MHVNNRTQQINFFFLKKEEAMFNLVYGLSNKFDMDLNN